MTGFRAKTDVRRLPARRRALCDPKLLVPLRSALAVLHGARTGCPAAIFSGVAPLDPATARHLGQCEYVSETDPAVLKFVLKVKPGLGEGYHWVECGACDTAWQVAHFAEIVG